MADSTPPPQRPRRLTKEPPGTRERPEVALARELVETEYALSNERGGGFRDAVQEIVQALRDAWRGLTGRLRPGTDERDASRAGGRDTGSSGRTAPERDGGGPDRGGRDRGASGAEESPQERLARLVDVIDRLPDPARRAFDTALLRLLQAEGPLRNAYEDGWGKKMPTVSHYANRAYESKLTGGAPRLDRPRTAPRLPDGPALWDAVEARHRAGQGRGADDARQERQRFVREAPEGQEQRDSSSAAATIRDLESNQHYDGNLFATTRGEELRTTAGPKVPDPKAADPKAPDAARSDAASPPSPVSPVSPVSPERSSLAGPLGVAAARDTTTSRTTERDRSVSPSSTNGRQEPARSTPHTPQPRNNSPRGRSRG
ncbi:hypothetical protein ACIQNG_32360 [Streptomyces sp. NPDC091377]|uniref:hypothetical protein n=1 Tax=Streptomyces sp. NPDC091377 TaxID=3365995 RepID=UPI003826682A